jgi:hypothetical protein
VQTYPEKNDDKSRVFKPKLLNLNLDKINNSSIGKSATKNLIIAPESPKIVLGATSGKEARIARLVK